VSTLLLAPICPHSCEHVWRDVLGRRGSVLTAGFPAASAPPDFALRAAAEYLGEQIGALRKGIEKTEAPRKKKGAQPAAPAAKARRAL
jgi:leucyl-tRNA synthetase